MEKEEESQRTEGTTEVPPPRDIDSTASSQRGSGDPHTTAAEVGVQGAVECDFLQTWLQIFGDIVMCVVCQPTILGCSETSTLVLKVELFHVLFLNLYPSLSPGAKPPVCSAWTRSATRVAGRPAVAAASAHCACAFYNGALITSR